jgi:pilus assembly protein Flp/PilA
MKNTIQRFQHDESGSTAIEYGFIALIIGLGIVASLQTIPPALSAIFASVGTYVN